MLSWLQVIHGVDEMPLPDSKDKAKNKTVCLFTSGLHWLRPGKRQLTCSCWRRLQVNVGSKGQVKGMSAGEGEVSRWRLLRADSMSRPGKKRDDPCSTPPTKPSPAGEESTLDPATLRGNFRIHPKVVPPPQIIRHGLSEFLISAVPLATHKGVGVVCIREEGIRGGTFIADYLGEIYPPWRW